MWLPLPEEFPNPEIRDLGKAMESPEDQARRELLQRHRMFRATSVARPELVDGATIGADAVIAASWISRFSDHSMVEYIRKLNERR